MSSDKEQLAKMREIGMRFVETCATCEHGARIPYSRASIPVWGLCKKHGINQKEAGVSFQLPANVLMCCNDYERRDSCVDIFMGPIKTIVLEGTRKMRWTVCKTCGWEGWNNLLIKHEMIAGDEVMYTNHCPKCQNTVDY